MMKDTPNLIRLASLGGMESGVLKTKRGEGFAVLMDWRSMGLKGSPVLWT